MSRSSVSTRPHDYFAAAVAILAEKGSGGLSVSELCSRVGVTSGSLYHHFAGLSGFTAEFLDYWLHAQDRRTPARLSPDEPHDAPLLRLIVTTARLPHAAEAAFRGWSLNEPSVQAIQARVDERRRANLLSAALLADLDHAAAERLAASGMAILVGMQLLHRPLAPDSLRAALLPLFRDVLGAEGSVVSWLAG